MHKLRVPQINAASLMTSNERDVEQPERVAEVAMVRRGRVAGPIGREPMGSVVVRNDHGVAVGIIAATTRVKKRRRGSRNHMRLSNVAAGPGHCQTPLKLGFGPRV